MKSSSSSASPAASNKFNSVYDQWTQQLNAEILEEEVDNTQSEYSSYSNYFSTSSNSNTATMTGDSDVNNVGKTKMSVSIIGDAFVDLFCFLNDGSTEDGGKLPGLGADVRVNQPGKEYMGVAALFVYGIRHMIYDI